MNAHDIRFVRRCFFAVLIVISLIALYVTTPPECFGEGSKPSYCVER